MSDKEEIKQDEESMEEDSVYQIFVDEDNNEIPFEILDFFEYENAEYVVLLPLEDEEETDEETEVVIFKLEKSSEDEETYTVVDDESVLEAVFEMFKQRNNDIYNFSD